MEIVVKVADGAPGIVQDLADEIVQAFQPKDEAVLLSA